MAILINNIDALKKILNTKIQQALILTQEEIYDVINSHIQDYYKEEVFSPPDKSTPDVYQRTYQFLNSLIKTEIVQTNNTLSCKVQISEDFLNYKYPGNTAWEGHISATGADVAAWANDCSHGGSVFGEIQFWDDAIDELGGKKGIYNLMKKNLKAVGVPIA